MNRYNELNEVQHGLMGNKTIDLIGEVDHSMVLYVREVLMRSLANGEKSGKFQPLKIVISSGGGTIIDGLNIYDDIVNYPGHVTGITNGMAASMAAIILQACDWRQSMEYSLIQIHNPKLKVITWDELKNKKKLAKKIEILDGHRKRMLRIWSEASGQPFKKIATICAKDEPMTAQEARKLGLIDEIVKAPAPNRRRRATA